MQTYYIAKVLYKLRLSSFKNCKIDKNAKVAAQCVLANVSMDRYSYIGSETHITNCQIGQFSSIGGGCQIGGGKHPLDMVSTSPVFLEGRNILKKNFSKIRFDGDAIVTIGDDVWIGDGCYIKAGVNIGSGAIIGAHAVVTRDVAPYDVAAGCPARTIRKRFSEVIINELLRITWWDWNEEKLTKYAEFFNNPEQLIAVLKEQGE